MIFAYMHRDQQQPNLGNHLRCQNRITRQSAYTLYKPSSRQIRTYLDNRIADYLQRRHQRTLFLRGDDP